MDRPDAVLAGAKLLCEAILEDKDIGQLVSLEEERIQVAVDGPNPLTASEVAFQAWALPRAAMQLRGPQGVHSLADRALPLDWGGLILLGQDTMFLVRQDGYAARLLSWLYEHWADLIGIQERFSTPVNPGNTIWDPPSNLHRAAGHLGVSSERLMSPGSEGFFAILQELKASGKF